MWVWNFSWHIGTLKCLGILHIRNLSILLRKNVLFHLHKLSLWQSYCQKCRQSRHGWTRRNRLVSMFLETRIPFVIVQIPEMRKTCISLLRTLFRRKSVPTLPSVFDSAKIQLSHFFFGMTIFSKESKDFEYLKIPTHDIMLNHAL